MSAAPPTATRAVAIDVLRGLVMVLMTVDHAREYSSGPGRVGDPMDLAAVTPLLFWMRWVAHFCAPVFVLLAGVSARLQGERLTRPALARHLLVRGLVLIVLEFTVVDWAWTFHPAWPRKFAQVIWAIGVSLVALALLVRLLPGRAVGAVGVALVAGHNLLDPVRVVGDGPLRYLWAALHQREVLPLGGGFEVRTTYPVLPLVGLAAVGYALGGWYTGAWRDPAHAAARRWRLAWAGVACVALFAVLRTTNVYGDPHPAVLGPDAGMALRSVLNTTKYPISLSFALMTIGPALLVLAAWDSWGRPDGAGSGATRPSPGWARPLALLGAVPMFYYVAHLYALHAAALAAALLVGFPPSAFDVTVRFGGIPDGFGFPLWMTVPFALGTTAALYPACRWYARLRASAPIWVDAVRVTRPAALAPTPQR